MLKITKMTKLVNMEKMLKMGNMTKAMVVNLRIAETWSSRSPFRLDGCNTGSCYSRLGKVLETFNKQLCLADLCSSHPSTTFQPSKKDSHPHMISFCPPSHQSENEAQKLTSVAICISI